VSREGSQHGGLGAKAPINTVMIVRTPTRLEGGLTDDERDRLAIHARHWIDVAYQTGRTNRRKLRSAIRGLYRAAKLPEPIVDIVASPLEMVSQYVERGYASSHATTCDVTYAATRDATRIATDAATDAETLAATRTATDAETLAATRTATLVSPYAATSSATLAAIDAEARVATKIPNWFQHYQGGNTWAAWVCYLTAFRDVLGLRLPVYRKFQYWEKAALYGGFRLMFSDRCIVSDFPDRICVDRQWRPHCDSGPSHCWSDGWELWHLHGVAVDEQIVLRPETQTVEQMDNETNADVQALRIERYGWPRYLRETGATCLDERRNDIDGTREALFRDRHGRLRLVATCPTARVFAPSVPAGIVSCEQAQNWLAGEKPFRTLART